MYTPPLLLDVPAVTHFHDRSLGMPEPLHENLHQYLPENLNKNQHAHPHKNQPENLPAENWTEHPSEHRHEARTLVPQAALWIAIADNHRCNRLLWQQEDLARRRDVPAASIVDCKRQIDRYNQQRNDAAEAIDAALLCALTDIPPKNHARRHSETPGAMVDRLSILSLKIFHMHRQTERPEASDDHRKLCLQKWACLQQQRADLAECLQQLMQEIRTGESFFTRYQQFKMYNDPALNPHLRGSGNHTS